MTIWRSLLCVTAALPLLAGCGNVRDSLGLGHAHADEFATVDRPPLSMPPDFTLRPPHAVPAAAPANAASDQPQTAPVAPPVAASPAEQAVSPQLLDQLNGSAAAPKAKSDAPAIVKDDGGWFGL